jgi:hypothetical protein
MQSVIEAEKETPHFDLQYIQADPFCADWLDTLKPSTLRLYGTGLALFCRHYQMTPEEIAKLSLDELKKMIRHYLRNLKEHARQSGGKNHRNGQAISVNTVRPYIRGIQSFTEHLELPIVWKNIQKALQPMCICIESECMLRFRLPVLGSLSECCI